MSDSFADLWNSTAPSNSQAPASAQQTLGSAVRNANRSGTSPSPNTNGNSLNGNKYDAFSILASSSKPNSRPITPLAQNSKSNLVSSMRAQAKPSTPSSSSTKPSTQLGHGLDSDAFSSLLGSSFTQSNDQKLSIAQKQAASERAREQERARESEVLKERGLIWDGLESIGSSKGGTSSSGVHQSKTRADGDLFSFNDLASTTPSHTEQSSQAWNDLISDTTLESNFTEERDVSEPSVPQSIRAEANVGTSSSPAAKSQMPSFDALDDFLSSPPTQQSKPKSSSSQNLSVSPIPSRSETNSPGDFDFGDREYRMLDDANGSDAGDENDNILGDLSSPVNSVRISVFFFLPDEY